MAIRIEFYVKDQVDASTIVEYALRSGGILQSYNEIDPPLQRADKPSPLKKVPKADSYTEPKKKRKPKIRPRLDYHNTWYAVTNRDNPGSPGTNRHAYMQVILRTQTPRKLSDIFSTVQRAHSDVAHSTLRECIRFLTQEKHLEVVPEPEAPPKRETPQRDPAPRMDYETTIVRVANRQNDREEGSIRWNQQDIILSFRKDISLREMLSTVMKRMKLNQQQESAVRSMIRDLIRKGNLEIVE